MIFSRNQTVMDIEKEQNKNSTGGRREADVDAQQLNYMRTTAWYAYVESSGVDFRKIRIKYVSNDTEKFYKDRDGQWRLWKNGRGILGELSLDQVEQKIPGSKEVYTMGPDGAPLWSALDPKINLEELTDLYFRSLPYPEELKKKLISSNFSIEHNEPEFDKILKELNITLPSTPWHDLVWGIIVLRARKPIMSSNMILPTKHDHHYLDFAKMAYGNADEYVMEKLENIATDARKYNLYANAITLQLMFIGALSN